MMARYSRMMALHPVNRIKHVIDGSATLAKATALTLNLIKAVDAPVIGNTAEVQTGSKVNGIYLRVEVASNETEVVGAIPNVYLAVMKRPSNSPVAPAINAVGASVNKKFIIHQEMLMIENSKGGNTKTIFNGVIKIPKVYLRNGPDDRLNLIILSPSIDIVVCFQCHYKEFR